MAEPDVDFSDAEAALAALSAEYPGYAKADIVRIEQLMHMLIPDAEGFADTIDAIFGVAHDIKGQGASFGYDLMTVLGDALCDLTREQRSMTASELDRAETIVSACRAVLDERLTGDGGPRGLALLHRLELTPERA
jgi:chemotaxis protein histidine kinase CheA